MDGNFADAESQKFPPDCLNKVGWIFISKLINLISITGDTDQTDEKLETAEVERRDRAETELDLHTESIGKIREGINN